MAIRAFIAADQARVIALWQSCGLTRPWNDPALDIARKLDVQAEWFVVYERDNALLGSAMIGYDGHRGWLNYLAVHPDARGEGIGRALVTHAEAVLREAGCPKLNLQVRAENDAAIAFYRALGFDVDAAVSLGKRLIKDAD